MVSEIKTVAINFNSLGSLVTFLIEFIINFMIAINSEGYLGVSFTLLQECVS